jgi:hypothetical protein
MSRLAWCLLVTAVLGLCVAPGAWAQEMGDDLPPLPPLPGEEGDDDPLPPLDEPADDGMGGDELPPVPEEDDGELPPAPEEDDGELPPLPEDDGELPPLPEDDGALPPLPEDDGMDGSTDDGMDGELPPAGDTDPAPAGTADEPPDLPSEAELADMERRIARADSAANPREALYDIFGRPQVAPEDESEISFDLLVMGGFDMTVGADTGRSAPYGPLFEKETTGGFLVSLGLYYNAPASFIDNLAFGPEIALSIGDGFLFYSLEFISARYRVPFYDDSVSGATGFAFDFGGGFGFGQYVLEGNTVRDLFEAFYLLEGVNEDSDQIASSDLAVTFRAHVGLQFEIAEWFFIELRLNLRVYTGSPNFISQNGYRANSGVEFAQTLFSGAFAIGFRF